jgi:hypothetical protein
MFARGWNPARWPARLLVVGVLGALLAGGSGWPAQASTASRHSMAAGAAHLWLTTADGT